MPSLLDSLKADLLRALELLGIIEERRMQLREKLYTTALSFLDRDPTPRDLVSDDVACVDSLEAVKKAATGSYLSGDRPMASTTDCYLFLRTSTNFEQVKQPQRGAIVICYTGQPGSTGHGHVGICGNYQIMSNNSANGRWEANYSIQGWIDSFSRRGFKTYYFLPV